MMLIPLKQVSRSTITIESDSLAPKSVSFERRPPPPSVLSNCGYLRSRLSTRLSYPHPPFNC